MYVFYLYILVKWALQCVERYPTSPHEQGLIEGLLFKQGFIGFNSLSSFSYRWYNEPCQTYFLPIDDGEELNSNLSREFQRYVKFKRPRLASE